MATAFENFVTKPVTNQSMVSNIPNTKTKDLTIGGLVSFNPTASVQPAVSDQIVVARSVVNKASGGSSVSMVPSNIVSIEQKKLDSAGIITYGSPLIYPSGAPDSSGINLNTGLDVLSSGDGNSGNAGGLGSTNRDTITIRDKETIQNIQTTIKDVTSFNPSSLLPDLSGLGDTISKYAGYALLGLGLILAINLSRK